ncbi:MAG: HAMP domain-containing protein [Acidobacteria bacterium]|nr:HAMP domain-containing protein [Acidobacteriota bacterium]
MPAPEPAGPASGPRRRFRWVWRGLVFLILVGLVFILGSINVPFLEPDEPSEVILLYVFSTVVFLAFIIYGLVLTRYLARLYTEHRARQLGSKFKTKMVVGALALSLLPVIALFFLSYALVNRTLAKWFPRPLEIVRDDAVYIVEYLLRQHEDRARELARSLAENPDLQHQLASRNAAGLQQTLVRVAERRKLHWAAVVDTAGQPLAVHRHAGARGDFLHKLPELLEPRDAVAYTTSEKVSDSHFSLARVRVESARGVPLGAVVVAQPLSATLLAKVAEIESESQAYEAITQERKSYRWQALLILLLITILILLAGTWSALTLAKQVTVPIQALAIATEEVSRGNFDYRVNCPAQDELGTLVASFNQMTAQLGESRRRLEQAVRELDQRRQWMEAILESIPTGVVTLSPDLRILNANTGAEQFLASARGDARLEERLDPDTAAACAELISQAAHAGFAARPMDFRLSHRIAHVAVSVSALRHGGQSEGYVLVLDDLTDLLKAQKAAAWQEVAQRIAHEIKNPLTPIQLSADRIRRYLERDREADPVERGRYRDLIAQCASLIAQEVHGLKALVDEFSRFARFPRVQPVPTQLNQVVESTLALYRDSANGIRLRSELAVNLPVIPADPDLLRRVLINLIENATEAVARAVTKEIVVRTRHLPRQRCVELTVSDTGPGISPENKERLFLPFFSTKASGMGLGLAIVSRIVAEHHGRISIEDNTPTGASFRVELPTETPATA